jgi:ankyrin repeat protein
LAIIAIFGPKVTPLLVAVAGREPKVRNISLLLEHGANPNFRSPRSTISPLAKEARFSRNPSIIAALLEAGADVNVGNKDGMTALHSASFGPD